MGNKLVLDNQLIVTYTAELLLKIELTVPIDRASPILLVPLK